VKTNFIYLFLLLQLSFFGCTDTYPDVNNLRKLSRTEILKFEKQGKELFKESAIWYNETRPTPEEMQQFKKGELYCDVFVDKANMVQLLKMRPASYHDNIIEILRRNVDFSPSNDNVYFDINCDSLATQFEELNLYRTKSKLLVRQIRDSLLLDSLERNDFYFNRVLLASVEKKCGFESLDIKGIKRVWSIAHHSEKETLACYFSYIEKQTIAGILHPEYLALATDRLLMYNDYKQVYGSQISNSELYSIRNVDSLNIRRAEIGLEPISDYLKGFELINTTSDFFQKVISLEPVRY